MEYTVILSSRDGQELHYGDCDECSTARFPAALLPLNIVLALRTWPNSVVEVNRIHYAAVYKNDKLYADICLPCGNNNSTKVGSSHGSYGFFVLQKDLRCPVQQSKTCSCGCWTTHGKDSTLHADWCDARTT